MAVIYRKEKAGTTYEVRTAGNTVRLYSNGVLHSQYNPNHPISGAIWDLLFLPVFQLKSPPKNILVLGLGGGTLLHIVRYFFPDTHITCVELDPEHIRIAKRFFKIPKKNVEVIEGDAYAYLKSSKTKFDWIVDDVFQHVAGEPERGNKSLYSNVKMYRNRLQKDGLLSLNLIGKKQIENIDPLIRDFKHVSQLTHPLYENRIVALSSYELDNRQFKLSLKSYPELDQSRKTCRLQFKRLVMK